MPRLSQCVITSTTHNLFVHFARFYLNSIVHLLLLYDYAPLLRRSNFLFFFLLLLPVPASFSFFYTQLSAFSAIINIISRHSNGRIFCCVFFSSFALQPPPLLLLLLASFFYGCCQVGDYRCVVSFFAGRCDTGTHIRFHNKTRTNRPTDQAKADRSV